MYYFIIIRVLTPCVSPLMARGANLMQVQNQKNTFLRLLVALVFLVRGTKTFHFLVDRHFLFLRMTMNLLSKKL
jgi:hypothetical protein